MSCSDKQRRRRFHNRRGQALVEFAIVSLVVYLLLAAILTFGQMLYCAQTVQQAADVAARELSRTPLAADATFDQALQDQGVRQRVFDERYLVLSIDAGSDPITFNGGHALGRLSVGNPTTRPDYDLRPDWRHSGVAVSGSGLYGPAIPIRPLIHQRVDTWCAIPVVTVAAAPAPATEQITWVPVLEEINSSANPNPFQISSAQRGVVALRVNYPFQSASMSGFQPGADPSQPGGASLVPISANGSGITANTARRGQPSHIGSAVRSLCRGGWSWTASSVG